MTIQELLLIYLPTRSIDRCALVWPCCRRGVIRVGGLPFSVGGGLAVISNVITVRVKECNMTCTYEGK